MLGEKRGSRRERWIETDTWHLIDERKALKKEKNISEQKQEEYRQKDKAVKRNCRRDKRQYVEKKAKEAEDAAMKGDSKELYRIVKDLTSSGPKKGMPIKDDFGKTLPTHEEQAKQWKHHFETVLNCPEPVICYDFDLDVPAPFDIGPDEIYISEVQHAIKKLKNNKAAGIDEIPAEYLKGGGDTMAQTLTHMQPGLVG